MFLALEMVLDVGGLGPGHRQVTGATDHLTVRLHQLRELCNRNILIIIFCFEVPGPKNTAGTVPVKSFFRGGKHHR